MLQMAHVDDSLVVVDDTSLSVDVGNTDGRDSMLLLFAAAFCSKRSAIQ
jgi:hypothetical protein